MADGIGKPGRKSLIQLLEEIRKDETLFRSVKSTDVNKFREMFRRAPQEMLKYAAQYTVSEDQLEDRLTEMATPLVSRGFALVPVVRHHSCWFC